MLLDNGIYKIQGIPVQSLINEFGSPLYVYDGEIIERQIKTLQNTFKDLKCKIKYACKALTTSSILKLICQSGCDIDTVSPEEIQLALNAGFKPQQITYTPSGVDFSEFEDAVQQGIFVNLDNLPALEKFGKKYGNSVGCSIRINPHVEAGGNEKIKTGHIASKFGISIDQLEEILDVVGKYDLNIIGLHVHTGSDFSEVDVFLKVAAIMFKVAKSFKNIKIIDFGSGFKVSYKDGDQVTNLQLMGIEMTNAVKSFALEYGSEPEIWFEPGKFIVSDSGILLVTTNVVKETPATTFVGVNSGLNHLIRPMMYGSYHEIVNITNPLGVSNEYSVVGYICETDTFGWKRMLTQVKEGDTLAILNAGAYGFTMSSNYNSRPRPAEVLIYKNKAHLIRKRETLDDILRNQINVEIET